MQQRPDNIFYQLFFVKFLIGERFLIKNLFTDAHTKNKIKQIILIKTKKSRHRNKFNTILPTIGI